MTTHSSILAWRIPWTEEPGGLQSMGLKRVEHNWVTNTHTHTHTHLVELTLSPLYLLRFLLGKWCSCLYISIFFKSCFLYLFMATPRSMWDLSSLTGYQTRDPAVEAHRPNSWATREVLDMSILEQFRRQVMFPDSSSLPDTNAAFPGLGSLRWGRHEVRVQVCAQDSTKRRQRGPSCWLWPAGCLLHGILCSSHLARHQRGTCLSGAVSLTGPGGVRAATFPSWLPCRLWVQFECV